MKSYFAFLTLLLCTISLSQVWAQKELKPGFIITLQQDTIYGFINNKSTSSLNTSCEFFSNNNSTSTIYKPGDISVFQIDNEKCFISKTVSIDGEDKTLFLEFLLEGIVNLYYCDYKRNSSYYIEKDDEIYELKNNHIEYENDNGIKYKKFDNKYKGILMVIFKDEPQLAQQINSSILSHKSLINLSKNYHDMVCTDHQCIIYEKQKKGHTVIRPFVGFQASSLSLTTSKDRTTYTSYKVGADFCFPTFNSSPRWDFWVGINLSKDEANAKFNNNIFGEDAQHRIYLKDNALQIPFSLEYTIPYKKILPFVGFGYSNVFLLNTTSETYRVFRYNDGYEQLADDHTIRYQSGLDVFVGFKAPFKKSYLYGKLGYQRRFSPARNNYYSQYIVIQSYSFSIGWAFNGNKQ